MGEENTGGVEDRANITRAAGDISGDEGHLR
jgi:hypothetical protein